MTTRGKLLACLFGDRVASVLRHRRQNLASLILDRRRCYKCNSQAGYLRGAGAHTSRSREGARAPCRRSIRSGHPLPSSCRHAVSGRSHLEVPSKGVHRGTFSHLNKEDPGRIPLASPCGALELSLGANSQRTQCQDRQERGNTGRRGRRSQCICTAPLTGHPRRNRSRISRCSGCQPPVRSLLGRYRWLSQGERRGGAWARRQQLLVMLLPLVGGGQVGGLASWRLG